MLGEAHPQKKVATLSAAGTGFALAGEANALSFVNAARNFDLIIFDFVGPGAAQRNRAGRSVQRFLERDHNVCFNIRSALDGCSSSTKSAESRAAAAAAEKRFEEIAESRPTKFKLHVAAAVTAPLIKSATGLTAPLRWRLESARLVPIGAELVVFLALLRIAQDFVGFVNLLKFFLGGFLVLGHVGMIFPGQFSKGAADLVLRCCFGNTERLVIIS